MENKHGSIMIGEGVRIEGKIDSATDVHVYGTVIGESILKTCSLERPAM